MEGVVNTPRALGWFGDNARPDFTREIPKKIWAYWNSDSLPDTVNACIGSWKEKNPDHEVNIVTPSSIDSFLGLLPEGFFRNTPQRQADWVRLALLNKYGGIWLDATIIAFKSFAYIHKTQSIHGGELVGYFLRGKTTNAAYPLIENWFLAAPAGTKFINDWLNEFEKSMIQGADNYIKSLTEYNIDHLRQGLQHPNYFSMHVAAQVLMRRSNQYVLTLIPAENDAYNIPCKLAWDVDRIVSFMTQNDNPTLDCNIFKMVGRVWKPLSEKIISGAVNPDSLIGKMISSSKVR
ncbi:glycosyltransferase family 32 protein [Pseudomonas sp. PSB11]|uniref:glycosyltransferase family 32 protein n=1 Tax=Pseudomonas sp. PSB11 TaxID=2021969 RepID=UPI001660AC9E|nr:capsular polysaccharide synthesis protein [Pseudomonas sp. PSB11]MBD0679815.1 hypothetical protein [Pseudomonas sp. PSB11]